MTDVLTPEQRQLNMRRIRGKNTKPELLVRRALHARGFRFRLHRRDLPGCPDLVLPAFSAAIFVHGCFWHGHKCPMFKLPATRGDFWAAKINANRERDARVLNALADRGWRPFIVWECALRGPARRPVEEVIESISDWLHLGQVENL